MRGFRKVRRHGPPKPRPGLDDPEHKRFVRAQRCLISGKIARLTRWKGVHPYKEQVTEEYIHVCDGPVDPHHTTRKSQLGHDHTCVPLCRLAHKEAERLGNDQFLEVWGVDLVAEAARLAPKPDGAAAEPFSQEQP